MTAKDYRNEAPFISPQDPLPEVPEPQGRWGEPFITYRGRESVWTAWRRHALTPAEIEAGLVRNVIGSTEEEVREKIREADGKADELSPSYRGPAR
ncbi:hypothetical protein [Actinomadura rugatobispora]|uniref:Uncharacterized protein n=1 Tax=Actinomadura rugatobispora TaxID=1994 RepID=A0ABW0ZRK5_9ACTN|nr:hypothetical protein GCM10010200_051610 [Actinomadura rugatobispora]